jgi:CheY-like chemotaxis protein
MTAILVVDDEPAVCVVIELLLGREGLTVVNCADGKTALAVLPSRDFAAALIDLGLEQVRGRHVIDAIREARPALPIVIMSGALMRLDEDDSSGLPARFEGLEWLPKPFKPQNLIALVSEVTGKQQRRAESPAQVRAAAYF